MLRVWHIPRAECGCGRSKLLWCCRIEQTKAQWQRPAWRERHNRIAQTTEPGREHLTHLRQDASSNGRRKIDRRSIRPATSRSMGSLLDAWRPQVCWDWNGRRHVYDLPWRCRCGWRGVYLEQIVGNVLPFRNKSCFLSDARGISSGNDLF